MDWEGEREYTYSSIYTAHIYLFIQFTFIDQSTKSADFYYLPDQY